MPRSYSIESYKELLTAARTAGYRFVRFTEAPAGIGKCLYLRHDIDYSLPLAADLAEANAALDVRGTFFLQLRSDMYNPFSPRSTEAIRRIRAAGQWLGLHFACDTASTVSDSELAAAIRLDFDLLNTHVEGIDPVFSWHNPTATVIDRGLVLTAPGLVNTYSKALFRDIRYASDSVMRRTPDELESTVRNESPATLQLLLHPLYWVIGGTDPVDVLARCWSHIIREREPEMQTNGAWAAANPGGIPEQALADFSARLGGGPAARLAE
jgi:hypothetical protein